MRWAMFGDTSSYLDSSGNPVFQYPYDYYIIKAVAVTLRPAYDIFANFKTQGSTMIDKDGQITKTGPGGWDIDPFGPMSSRRTWDPSKPHRRYFIPKPRLAEQGSGASVNSEWFLGGRNRTWINCTKDQLVHYGMGLSLRCPANSQQALTMVGQITFYISFGQFTGF